MCLRYNDKLRPSAEELIDYIEGLEGNFNTINNVKVKKINNFRSFLGKEFEYPKEQYKKKSANKNKRIVNSKSENNITKKRNNKSIVIECKDKVNNKENLDKSHIIEEKRNLHTLNNKLVNKKKFVFKDKKKAIKNLIEREKEINKVETEFNKIQKEEKKEEINYENLFKEKMKDDNLKIIRTYSGKKIREDKVNNSDNIRKVFIGWSLAESYNIINKASKGNLPKNSSIIPLENIERSITPNFGRKNKINNSIQINGLMNYKIKDCKKIEENTIKMNRNKIRKININKFKIDSFKKVKSRIFDK